MSLASPSSPSSPPSMNGTHGSSKIEKFESLSVSSMGLNDNDKKFYEQIFRILDHMQTGLIPLGTTAIHSLLERANLPRSTVEKILGLVDPYERKVLDKKAVYVLLRFITCAQNDCPVSYPSLSVHTDLPLPKIRGVELDPNQQPPTSSPNPHSQPHPSSYPPVVPHPQLQRLPSSNYTSPMPSPRGSPAKGAQRSEFTFDLSSSSPPGSHPLPAYPSPSPGSTRESFSFRPSIHEFSTPPSLRQTQSLSNLNLVEDVDKMASTTPTRRPSIIPSLPRSYSVSVSSSPKGGASMFSAPPPLPTLPFPPNFPTMPAWESVVWPIPPPPLTDTDKMWIMSEKEMHSYRHLFKEYDTNHDGFMSGKEARAFFVKSKMEKETLSKIWVLSDLSQDGKLDENEFCICMHLTMGVSKKLCLLPQTLPRIIDPRIPDPRNPMTALFNLSLDPHEIQEGKRKEQRRLHMSAVAEYANKNPEQKAQLDEMVYTKLTSTRLELKFVADKLQQATGELDQINAEIQQLGVQIAQEQRIVEGLHKDSLDLKLNHATIDTVKNTKKEKLDWSKKFLEQTESQTDTLRLQIQESEVESEIIEQELQHQTAMLTDIRELRQHQAVLLRTKLQRLPTSVRTALLGVES